MPQNRFCKSVLNQELYNFNLLSFTKMKIKHLNTKNNDKSATALQLKGIFFDKQRGRQRETKNDDIDIKMGTLTMNFSKLTKKQKQDLYRQYYFWNLTIQEASFKQMCLRQFPLIKQCRDNFINLSYHNGNINIKNSTNRVNELVEFKMNCLWPIVHINFPNLQVLKICSQNLDNIEALSHLKAPKLKDLQINQCLVTSVRSLSKATFPNLQQITLYGNPIANLFALTKGNYKKLCKYQLDQFSLSKKRKNVIVGENYCFLFKMKFLRVQKLVAEHYQRIYIENAEEVLLELNTGANLKLPRDEDHQSRKRQ